VAKKASKKSVRRTSKNASGRSGVPPKASGRVIPVAALKGFFEDSGVRFDLTTNKILDSLLKQMGPERFRRWQSISSARHMGREYEGNEYAFFDNAAELNTVFSLQAPVSLAVCSWLSEQVSRHANDKPTIGDLGCGAGILAGWLARNHPDSSVYGFDALSNVVEAAETSQKAPHLQFHQWDYAAEPYRLSTHCDLLISCFGLDFPTDERTQYRHSLEDLSIRGMPYYEKMKRWFLPIYQHWRSASRDGATAYLVFRIPDDGLFLAAVDAAHEAGWTFDVNRYHAVEVGSERFPAMTFLAASSPLLPEQVVLGAWARKDLKKGFPTILKDTAAISVFRSLANKSIAKAESRTYDDGHIMKGIVGTAGNVGFRFTHATTGFARLQLMSAMDALEYGPGFPEDGDMLTVDDVL
jgi:hypothetical protein